MPSVITGARSCAHEGCSLYNSPWSLVLAPNRMPSFSGSSCRDRTADFQATVERLRSSQVPCSVSIAFKACCANALLLRPL